MTKHFACVDVHSAHTPTAYSVTCNTPPPCPNNHLAHSLPPPPPPPSMVCHILKFVRVYEKRGAEQSSITFTRTAGRTAGLLLALPHSQQQQQHSYVEFMIQAVACTCDCKPVIFVPCAQTYESTCTRQGSSSSAGSFGHFTCEPLQKLQSRDCVKTLSLIRAGRA